MTHPKNRNQLADLLNELGLVGEAAFVGVAAAYFEAYFAERWLGRANWIDPWRVLDTLGFSGHGENDDAGQEKRYQDVLRVAAKFNGRVKVIRATSEEAAPRFGNASLDFCYLDAAHNYDSIKQDIALWAPKIRPGGILAGHDYLQGEFNGQMYGVKQAADEFAARSKAELHVTSETDWPSWYVRRNPL